MKKRRFLIPSLLAAGFTSPPGPAIGALPNLHPPTDDPQAGNLYRLFGQDHEVQLAGHRSHSSHSSHRSSYGGGGGHYSHSSHTSHRSSYGGGYSAPAPVYQPSRPTYSAPDPAPTPTAPVYPSSTHATAPLFSPTERANEAALRALSGRSERFTAIVRRVQIALLAQGYYAGMIDGIVGPVLRRALKTFQGSRGLAVTGTITPETLDALMVASQ